MATDGGGKAPRTEDEIIKAVQKRLLGLKRDFDDLAEIYFNERDDKSAAAATRLNELRYGLHAACLEAAVENLEGGVQTRGGDR